MNQLASWNSTRSDVVASQATADNQISIRGISWDRQVAPMNSSSNADLEVWVIMMALTLLLVFLPFIPFLRSIPRWTRVYKLIWRRHYRELLAAPSGAS